MNQRLVKTLFVLFFGLFMLLPSRPAGAGTPPGSCRNDEPSKGDGCTKAMSTVINSTRAYLHDTVDYRAGDPAASGGCTDCTNGKLATYGKQGALPSLEVARLHRFRFGALHWSFGPGTSMAAYDRHLELWPGVVRSYDATDDDEWTFSIYDAGRQAFIDYEDENFRKVVLFDANGVDVGQNYLAARRATLTHHNGNTEECGKSRP